MQKVIAKINVENIRQNAALYKARCGVKLCAVVKADAYGHGGEEVTLALAEQADMFAVALVEEGLAIRTAACGKDILVFTPPVEEAQAYALLSGGLVATVPDLFTAKLLVRTCKKYGLQGKAHIKVNTGMNRYGMNASMLGRVCNYFKKNPCVQVEGIYSHLYTQDWEISEKQRTLFVRLQRICKGYFPAVIAHLGATYGSELGEEYAFDMLRVGLGLYGYSPTTTSLPLKKAMAVYAQISANRKYGYGGAGYGEVALPLEKGERIALCRVGYADGYLRRRGNGAEGAEGNLSNLCMDVTVRKSTLRRGAWTPVMTDAERVAKQTGTITYEVLCAATRRAEKIYE